MSRNSKSLNINLEAFDPAIRDEVAADIKTAEMLLDIVSLLSSAFKKTIGGLKSLRSGRMSAHSA